MSVISKWGNSLAVRIPKPIAEQLRLNEGNSISISIYEEGIFIKPNYERKKYSLEQLLIGMTPDKLHPETETGLIVGQEEW